MSPKDLAVDLAYLSASGFKDSAFTRLHHFGAKGRTVYLADAISYFDSKSSIRGSNLTLAERCRYVADRARLGRRDWDALLVEALLRWPLLSVDGTSGSNAPTTLRQERHNPIPRAQTRSAAKQLGDAGEALAARLLRDRGYEAELLPTNYPAYDLVAKVGSSTFYVSVKVARDRQHLRLGTRKSVTRLSHGDFIFAFLSRSSAEVRLTDGGYKLLILPAQEVRDYALLVHDAYWAAKGVADGYSVMIKAYDSNHAEVWRRWSAYEDAWSLLPATNGEA